MVPTHTLFGIMAALLQREKTGLGQTVEISQLESAIAMKPIDSMVYAANGEIMGPLGCGDPNAAPHGVIRLSDIENGWPLRCFPRRNGLPFRR